VLRGPISHGRIATFSLVALAPTGFCPHEGIGTLADFAVDYGLLQQIQKSLGTLKNELSKIEAVPHAANWGHGGIDSALGSFAGNWSHHRGNLVNSAGAMAKNALQTVTETQQYDTTLQQQLTRK